MQPKATTNYDSFAVADPTANHNLAFIHELSSWAIVFPH